MNIGVVSNLLKENYINNNKTLGTSLEKLSTGLRINKASDDASGLAISDKLRTQASGIKQGIDNANMALTMMNIADKSMSELSSILDTIKAKAIQMNTDTTSNEGRKIIKTDILKLIDSYDNIVRNTNYNQTPLLNGCATPFSFQVGDSSSDIIDININSVKSRHMGEEDPYKLKNFITGFNTPVVTPVIPPVSDAVNSSVTFETTGISGLTSTFVVTQSPPIIPLTVADRANVKIGLYSSSDNSYLISGMNELSNHYTNEGFSTQEYGTFGTTNRLNTYSLDCDLLFISMPKQSFDSNEIQSMQSFLDKGGRIFFVGENSAVATYPNSYISDAITSLGGNMKILNNAYDSDNDNTHTNTDGNMNLNNTPLLAGVTTFTTDCYADLEVSGNLTQAIIVDDNNRIVMAEQGVSKGRISLIADANWFIKKEPLSNFGLDSSISQNKTFLNNLAISSYVQTQFVDSGKNPNIDNISYSFSDKEPYSSLLVSSPSQPQSKPSCDEEEVVLIRNDDNPTLLIQAQNLMKVIDESLNQLNSQRGNIGAGINQLESSAKNHMTNYVNIKSAESIIRDVDYANESSNFNKANIIVQAGSYVQSQANEIDKQSISQLLK